MEKFNYSEQLPDELFNEMKELAIGIWSSYDNTYYYASDKINSFIHWENIRDNIWSIYWMFDWQNQNILYQNASSELRAKIDDLNAYTKSFY